MGAEKKAPPAPDAPAEAMWRDFFARRCPTARDVINSAVVALSLRDARIAELDEQVRELTAECKLLQRTREDLRREITMLETHGQRP
jgi:FtsZ-binding cell division protein ZapB